MQWYHAPGSSFFYNASPIGQHKAELKLSALSVEHRDASVKLLQDELHRRSAEYITRSSWHSAP